MRRAGANAIALAVLAACTSLQPGTTTKGSPPPRGRPPAHLGDRIFCNRLTPIQATGRFFYPSPYPSGFLPEPDRCFTSVEDARAAGLRLALPPPGSRLIAGIYLMQTGRPMLRTCRRAARRLRFAVACPSLVPSPDDKLEIGRLPGQFLLGETFAAPSTYVGSARVQFGSGSIGHLYIESVQRPPSRGFCTGSRFLFSIELGRRHARYLNCPEGSDTHSGHVLLVWRQAGATHLVSLHGRTPLNRRIDYVLVNHSRIVQPSGHEQPVVP
jgi:hypothetical protein